MQNSTRAITCCSCWSLESSCHSRKVEHNLVSRFAFHHQHISDNARNKDTINSCGRTDELNMIYRDAKK